MDKENQNHVDDRRLRNQRDIKAHKKISHSPTLDRPLKTSLRVRSPSALNTQNLEIRARPSQKGLLEKEPLKDRNSPRKGSRVPPDDSERAVSRIKTASTQRTSPSPSTSGNSVEDTLTQIELITSDLFARHIQSPEAQTTWSSTRKLLDSAISAARADREEMLVLRRKCRMVEEELNSQKGELNDCYEAIEILESQLEEKDEAVEAMQFANDELREKAEELEGMFLAAQIEIFKANHEKAYAEMALSESP
ncbi:hypothetical protein BJ742DRAFT_800649 [Cladochytrium replicatum]|nr:hypothetical protein BJ742DRAFT_800649 [Cladochytrium replicatum]